jgi:hypothetical protein
MSPRPRLIFDPLDAEPSWPALHEVVRDPSRNFLFNHLGLNEDAKIYLRPPRRLSITTTSSRRCARIPCTTGPRTRRIRSAISP